MKRLIAVILMVVLLTATMGCGQKRQVDGIVYDTYGLLDSNEKQNDDIVYEPVWGSIFWGVIFFETIIVPVYVFGFDLFEPVGKKTDIKGQVIR